MLRHFFLFFLTVLALSATFRPATTSAGPTAIPAATDTLTAGVFPPKPTVLKGATRDLADLDVRLVTLQPGKMFALDSEVDSLGHLLIVKDGEVFFPPDKTLGPGGIGLFSCFMGLPVNKSKSNASFYLFTFKSRTGTSRLRALEPYPFFYRNWSELVVKPTPKGESRAIFSQPTMSLKNINMHATTLNPGEISHPQHMHRAEEILILRSGNVRMHIGNGYIPAKGGDIVFLPSGVPHDLENGTNGRTEYFALQWEP
jgi:mannose-6-phosphate isomerase-like protein (cupin superfamily)